MPSHDWLEKDFYAVLGVPADASADQVKKTYRKLARAHHPDANPGDAVSEARFKEVGEAFAVLGDPEQRKQYDQIRTMTRGGARFTAGGPGGAGFEDIFGGMFGGAPGGRSTRYAPGGGPGGQNVEDMLNAMFAAQGGFGPGPSSARGQDLSADVTISFRQALEGAQLTLTVPEPGGPARTVTARMPAGVRDGQKVRLRGKGRAPRHGAPGDLVVTVHVESDAVFSLDGSDVRVTVPVTFVEAALGADVEAPLPEGGTVKLRIAPGTASGSVLRVKGRGARTAKGHGDLLVTVQVAVPQKIDGRTRKALDALAQALGDADPRASLLARARAGGLP